MRAGVERGALVLRDEIGRVSRGWRTWGLKELGCDCQVGWEQLKDAGNDVRGSHFKRTILDAA